MTVFPDLMVFDDNMDVQARIKRAESFTYTENWYDPDTFELKIDRERPGADELVLGGFIGWTDDLGVIRIGLIENIEQPRNRDSEQWVISGRGSVALLARRNCMNMFADATYSGYDKVTGIAYETALRHFVTSDVISPSDANRTIAEISLDSTDYLRGGTCEKQARGENLLDVLRDLSLNSTLAYDLVWTGAAATPGNRYTWKFCTYWGNYQPGIKLSINFNNILSYKYLESILNYANFAYVAGDGDGATRPLQKVYSGTEPTGRDRFETFVDATDCTTTDQLTARGLEVLNTKTSQRSIDFDYNPESVSKVLGIDFGCGDTVTVIDDRIAVAMVDRITSVTTTYAGNGKEVKIGMGTSPLDLVSIERLKKKQVAGARK